MSRPQWGKYLWQLAIAIIPVPLTIWLTVLYVQDRGGVQNLEYTRAVREAFVNLPEALPSKLQLTYDGNPVENLSSVRYQIFNRSGKSFQDVKLFFEIKPIDGKPVQLLSRDIKGPEGYPRHGFQEISLNAPSLAWNVDTVNASDSLIDSFEVSLLFLGPSAPVVDIAVLKTGVGLEPLTVGESSELSSLLKISAQVTGGLAYLTFLIWFFRQSKVRRENFYAHLKSNFTAYLEKKKSEIPSLDSGAMASDLFGVYKQARRESIDPIDALALRLFDALRGDRKQEAQQLAAGDAEKPRA